MINTVLLCTVALFVWFLVAMYYLRRRHELRTRTGLAYWLLVAAIIPGVAFDVIYNWTIGVLLFMVKQIEKLVSTVYEGERRKHLEKVAFHTTITPDRLDLIIQCLQRIRKTVLEGAGVKEAIAA